MSNRARSENEAEDNLEMAFSCLISNRAQIMLKCAKNKKVVHEVVRVSQVFFKKEPIETHA